MTLLTLFLHKFNKIFMKNFYNISSVQAYFITIFTHIASKICSNLRLTAVKLKIKTDNEIKNAVLQIHLKINYFR